MKKKIDAEKGNDDVIETSKNPLKSLNKVFDEIQKKYGKECIVDLKENPTIERYKLDSLAFNYLLGNGFPKGRIIEVYGQPSNGKSLVAMYLAKQIQDLNNGFVVYLDYEFSFDPEFAKLNGIDLSPNKFQYIPCDTIEQGFDIAEQLAESGSVQYIIWDSTNASKSKSESNGEYGDALMGVNARAIGQGLRKITGILAKSKTTMLFISQIRDTMSQYTPQAIGCVTPDTMVEIMI